MSARLRSWLAWVWLWLAAVEPDYQTVRVGSRDRSLRGKDRRRARKAANRPPP